MSSHVWLDRRHAPTTHTQAEREGTPAHGHATRGMRHEAGSVTQQSHIWVEETNNTRITRNSNKYTQNMHSKLKFMVRNRIEAMEGGMGGREVAREWATAAAVCAGCSAGVTRRHAIRI